MDTGGKNRRKDCRFLPNRFLFVDISRGNRIPNNRASLKLTSNQGEKQYIKPVKG
jgi:hypothetical protein